jgi:Sel1 repeat protein
MHKSLKYTLIVLGCLAAMFICFLLWLQCNPIHIGGANGQVKPAYCSIGEKWQEKQRKKETMKTIEEIKKNLEFTCVHEKRPPLSEETQQLYNYALHRDLNHMWPGQRGDGFWDELLPYYRIAAANGDYKANVRLQFLLSDGWTRVPDIEAETEVHKLYKMLHKQLPATAYYLLKGYIEDGYGVSAPPDSELAFLRKAADMGNREAQYTLGQMISSLDDEETREFRLKLMMKLYRCASEQGQGNASYWLGMFLPDYHKYDEAVRAYHQGVKNGNYLSAFILSNAFKVGKEKGNNNFLDVEADKERARRYSIIDSYLSTYEFMSPTVPDLDDIVPLPPAPLPEWDGKIAFQRWVEGNEPPKPSDELIKKLADKAGLDVKTGLPL